jgi:hypothetical protein
MLRDPTLNGHEPLSLFRYMPHKSFLLLSKDLNTRTYYDWDYDPVSYRLHADPIPSQTSCTLL